MWETNKNHTIQRTNSTQIRRQGRCQMGGLHVFVQANVHSEQFFFKVRMLYILFNILILAIPHPTPTKYIVWSP